MAKQSGIHQIKGKVGEMSYYQQSGVSAGLVRRINQGLSERVKNDAAYSNTRLNNLEFARATKIAALMINQINPRFRPMFNTFRNARLSKMFLEILKAKSGAWGFRQFVSSDRINMADDVNMLAKNNFDELFDVEIDPLGGEAPSDIEVIVTPAESYSAITETIGANGVDVRILRVHIMEGRAVDGVAKVVDPIAVVMSSKSGTITDPSEEVSPEMEYVAPTAGQVILYAPLDFVFVVALPYRELGGNKYILQEACTFKCISDPSGYVVNP